MLLQLALDKPEDFALIRKLSASVDIIEVGTSVLKRFGISAITTASELASGTAILADSKTVDGGAYEAEMLLQAGASYITVLSSASPATISAACEVADRLNGEVIVDTITQRDDLAVSPDDFPRQFGYLNVHAPTDERLAGHDALTGQIERAVRAKQAGFRVSVAGGIGPENIERIVAADPDIIVVGSAITEADDPIGVAQWLAAKVR